MVTGEIPLPDEVRSHIPGAVQEGAALVGVTTADPPSRIVEAINEFIAKPPKKSWFKKVDNWNERAMPLGALWGIQMIRQFQWEWTMVEDDEEESKVIAVFDKRRSLGIYPFQYVFGCLESGEYPTILLAFNMLLDGSIPTRPERGYENLMDGVQHIVPPR